MIEYKKFRPTGFDRHINIDTEEEGREDWLVLEVGKNRDSEALALCNFDVALEELGGEGDDVEVHRFGHWGHGWFEIILIRPGSKSEKTAYDIERSLEDYPVLDDMKLEEYELREEL